MLAEKNKNYKKFGFSFFWKLLEDDGVILNSHDFDDFEWLLKCCITPISSSEKPISQRLNKKAATGM